MPGRIVEYLPELKGEEQIYAARLMKPMDEEEARQFASIYRERRKDPIMVLMLTLAPLPFGIAGVNRFFLEKVGTGLLYVFTFGLCLVGSIIDATNYKSQTLRYNRRQADEVAALVRSTPTADELW